MQLVGPSRKTFAAATGHATVREWARSGEGAVDWRVAEGLGPDEEDWPARVGECSSMADQMTAISEGSGPDGPRPARSPPRRSRFGVFEFSMPGDRGFSQTEGLYGCVKRYVKESIDPETLGDSLGPVKELSSILMAGEPERLVHSRT